LPGSRASLRRRALLALAPAVLAACAPGRPPGPVAPALTRPTAGPINLSVAVWTDPVRTWMPRFVQQWAQGRPEVRVQAIGVPAADLPATQAAALAAGTLPDLTYNSVTWLADDAARGAFRPLDDLAAAHDPGRADTIPVALAAGRFAGQQLAWPFELTTGNQNLILYNRDLLDAHGVAAPTDDWQQPQFAEAAAALTDRGRGVFGTDYLPGTYYDFDALLRGNHAELFSPDGRRLRFDDVLVQAQVQWATELRTTYHAAPTFDEFQLASFVDGKVAYHADGLASLFGLARSIGRRFRWDAVLGPVGPLGRRGFVAVVLLWAIAARSRAPETAFDLLRSLVSPAVQQWALAQQGQPPALRSLWAADATNRTTAVWARALRWITSGQDQGPFPLPANFREQALQQVWLQDALPLFYGQVDPTRGLQKLQADGQAVLDQPVPTLQALRTPIA
jgi:multiple sugar transport system substrate-binding protein